MTPDVDALTGRALSLAARGRALLGIAGPPGAGKSALATAVAARAAATSSVAPVVVPMDGFHLAQRELERLGRADRKGAPDTFDLAGYLTLLRRLRDAGEGTVYAPAFRRDLEEPVAGAIPVPPQARLVITEGNYLLLDEPGWRDVPSLLDEVWYLDCDSEVRLEQLVARHVRFGRSPGQARRWVERSDEANARLVAATAAAADVQVRR